MKDNFGVRIRKVYFNLSISNVRVAIFRSLFLTCRYKYIYIYINVELEMTPKQMVKIKGTTQKKCSEIFMNKFREETNTYNFILFFTTCSSSSHGVTHL